MKPTPQAIENAARAMLASVKWSSFWSPDDARVLAQAALSTDLGDMTLAPKEPTTTMLRAGRDAWIADDLRRSSTLYRAMIAVAEGE